MVIPTFYYIKKKLDIKTNCLITNCLKEIFDSYVEKYEIFSNSVLIASSFLHPYYKDFDHANKAEQIELKQNAIEFLSVLDNVQPIQNDENLLAEKNETTEKNSKDNS